MIKKILKLNGARELNRHEQKSILGGLIIPKDCCDFEIVNGRVVCTYRIKPGQYCP